MSPHSVRNPSSSSHLTGVSNLPRMANRSLVKVPRVGLYIRVSTEKQADYGLSLEAQESELRRFASDRKWEVIDLYVDGGFSGKSTDQRPAYQQMIGDIERGRIDTILVTKMDRLTRSVRNLCDINDTLLKTGKAALVCIRDGINTYEVGSTLLMHLLAVIGQIERENGGARVSAAIRHIQDSGGHYGRIPFGYRTAQHPSNQRMLVLEPDPEAYPVLQSMFEWYEQKVGMTEIARRMNQTGVMPRYGGVWDKHKVYELLRTNGKHKPRQLGSNLVFDRAKAHEIAFAMREDERTYLQIAAALTKAGLRPKNAPRYQATSVQDLLRSAVFHDTATAEGLAKNLKQRGYSYRAICDELLRRGFTAPRGGRWYPATVGKLLIQKVGSD